MQTVPRHPRESAPPHETLTDITYRFQHHLDHALTPQQFGHRALQGVEANEGYIIGYYTVSDPCMILLDGHVQVPRPPEHEALDEIVEEEDREHGFLELGGRLGRIRSFERGLWWKGLSL